MAERVTGGFGALYPVLRAMEDAGQCRRGYFVEGLGAAQFALPGAVDRMRAMAVDPGQKAAAFPSPAQDPWVTAGPEAAPAPPPRAARWWCWRRRTRPMRTALRWPGRPAGRDPGRAPPGRKAGALVVLADGQLVLYVERGGKTLLSWTSDPDLLGPAAAALADAVRDGALGRLAVERADGGGVYDSPLAQALEAGPSGPPRAAFAFAPSAPPRAGLRSRHGP